MQWRVAVDEEETTAIFEPGAPRGGRAVFVCAHGAGGHREDRGMVRLAAVLRAHGFDLVRFNFLYREKGSGRPDTMPRLKRCLGAVVSRTRQELSPRSLIIGGRSMGGRAASMLAADGMACDALLLLAYPLHPAGKPQQLRDAHWLEGADHSFHVLKSSGRTDADVLDEVGDVSQRWLARR